MSNQRPIDSATRLKLARESKGMSPKQVAEATKLSVRTIEALESNRLSVLPSGIYRRSIIRAVAIEVGLDPVQLLRDFTNANPNELPPPEDVMAAESHAPIRATLQRLMTVVGAVVPLAAGIGYFALSDRTAPDRPALTQARPADTWRPEIVPAGGFVEAPPPVQRAVVVTLTMSSRCELRVVADGREILGRTVDAGETLQVELADEVLLSGDNASAVQFSINGQAGRSLGVAGDPLSVRIGRDDYETFLVRH